MQKSGNPTPELRLVDLAAPVRHAIWGLTALADRPEAFLDVAAIARRFALPSAALSKCFQRLAHQGLVESRRGPRGGYRLRSAPERITLAAVAAAVDVNAADRRCLLSPRPCGDQPCVLHTAAVAADACLRQRLDSTTLADLAASPRRNPR